MDPLTISSAFATLVGLIVNYRQERGARDDLTHQDFADWLEQHRHSELKTLIIERSELQIAVDKVLRADHERMLGHLAEISTHLAGLLKRMDEFRPLGELPDVSSALSDQAIHILRSFMQSSSRDFQAMRFRGDLALKLMNGGTIAVSDQRFLPDDLDVLVSKGYLTRKPASGGDIYGITRIAAAFIQSIDEKNG